MNQQLRMNKGRRMSDDVCDRVLKLEISEAQILKDLEEKGKQLTSISNKQGEIFKMILAVKWLSLGMIGLLLVQNVGFMEVLKKVLL